MSRARLRRLAVTAAVAALVALPVAPAAAAGPGETEVVIVHGVPGLKVDVLVDGATALRKFEFGGIQQVTLPSATYRVEIIESGTTGPVLLGGNFTLPSGGSVTLAAHLKADGSPTLAAYVNQRSATGIQPFHLAQFGAVDILAGGAVALKGVTNGQTARIDVPANTPIPGVGVAATGSGTAAIDLGIVEVPPSTLVLAYAIGSAADGSLTVVTSSVATGGAVPTGVPSGLAPSVPTSALLVAALAALAALGSVVPAYAARRR